MPFHSYTFHPRRPTHCPGAALLSLLALVSLAWPAVATGGHRHHRFDTLAGSCELAGTVTWDPPVTNSPRQARQSARLRGTCSGSFTDGPGNVHQLDDEPIEYRSRAEGKFACGFGGESPGDTSTGTGRMKFRYGVIHFDLSETRVIESLIRLDGAAAGSAGGQAGASSDENPLEIVQKCAGEGLSEVGIDFSFETNPEISG